MPTITIELTDAEVKAMEHVAVSVQDWAENALKNRARQAMDEIYNSEVQRMTEDTTVTAIPADKEAVVLAADIKSAQQRNEEAEAEMASMEA